MPPRTSPGDGGPLATPPPSTDKVEMTATLNNHTDSIIPTPGGVVRVRPFRSSSNAQLKAVLSFTPRVSALDRHNTSSQTDQFRGFFVLFWIGLALLFLRTTIESWETNRTPLSWTFGRLITGDALVLAISDGIMVLSMFLCVPFVKALQYGWFDYNWTGSIIQHVFQSLYLAIAVWWGYHRQWYWVQSGFLVLREYPDTMQMHSYMAHNGMLATVSRRLQKEKRRLEQVIAEFPGGKEALLREAGARKADLEAEEAEHEGSREASIPLGTPAAEMTPVEVPLPSAGYEDPSALPKKAQATVSELKSTGTSTAKESASRSEARKRLHIDPPKQRPYAKHALPSPRPDLPLGTSLEPSHTTSPHSLSPPGALAWSSNEEVALLATNIDAMQEELKSNGDLGVVWPQNVTYKHFWEFMLFPTLVYQLEYPRTETMRPLVVLEKIVATFGTFSLIYTITEHYIMPHLPKEGDSLSLIKSFISLALPMMINYLLIFYIIFECVCTGFAELSYFADREFYQDWWNSTSWDQFSRKWNKPVHTFLLRHVYASTMSSLQLSRTSAAFVTFLLSALCHELVMAVVTKKIRPYLFLMQMAQLPMIALGRLPVVKRNKTIGNIVFWIGLMMGFPLLAICYLVW
ncbi:sterol O-acyltransferase [Cryptococcus wingfieldii CBS 7118]|uniref:O-acyltransferase n=1 Tax=Cryptococcus wingfieldii CBS 7118 TaxID=1295528 RepID=A0A1E3J8Z0_9TREE|nr:sterol O-acyltransferase [Cryptococcus wingfieldii CBS 7118]ODN97324.1 sterol O-acyltransferase [Cryptococcus wingfieldii CBS 7118]